MLIIWIPLIGTDFFSYSSTDYHRVRANPCCSMHIVDILKYIFNPEKLVTLCPSCYFSFWWNAKMFIVNPVSIKGQIISRRLVLMRDNTCCCICSFNHVLIGQITISHLFESATQWHPLTSALHLIVRPLKRMARHARWHSHTFQRP